jgi:L,D-peptidoglycan transpeptidase YkuD (ErfK/YbiS/YcfS/YnhG family)
MEAPWFWLSSYCGNLGLDSTQQGVSKMITHLHVRAINERAVEGRLHVGGLVFPCIIGRNGRTHNKREGDGKTPVGRFWLRQGFYRADRMFNPGAQLGFRVMRRNDGWCEVPGSGFYNRHVQLPFRDGHETMWRDDEAYDVVFASSHNERPRVQGRGSAIFFHMTRDGSRVTAGCVAVSKENMRKVLALCGKKVVLVVWPGLG